MPEHRIGTFFPTITVFQDQIRKSSLKLPEIGWTQRPRCRVKTVFGCSALRRGVPQTWLVSPSLHGDILTCPDVRSRVQDVLLPNFRFIITTQLPEGLLERAWFIYDNAECQSVVNLDTRVVFSELSEGTSGACLIHLWQRWMPYLC